MNNILFRKKPYVLSYLKVFPFCHYGQNKINVLYCTVYIYIFRFYLKKGKKAEWDEPLCALFEHAHTFRIYASYIGLLKKLFFLH